VELSGTKNDKFRFLQFDKGVIYISDQLRIYHRNNISSTKGVLFLKDQAGLTFEYQ
jgi:hypothetical protein